MNRYWDLNDEEKAALSQEDIEALCKVELMENGVLRPGPPVLEDETPIEIDTRTYYRPKVSDYAYLGVAFETADQAAAFVNLKPVKVEENYRAGDRKYAAPSSEMVIEPIELMSEADFNRLRVDIERVQEAKTKNATARREYDAAIAKTREATEGVWEDWHRCRNRVRDLEKIRADFTEYVELCAGNEGTAFKFLLKAHGRGDIEDALGKVRCDSLEPDLPDEPDDLAAPIDPVTPAQTAPADEMPF